MRKDRALEYGAIPGHLNGQTHLTIWPPGTWIRNEDYYLVMVGGCGVCQANTLEEAEAELLAYAIRLCDNYAKAAIEKAMHYTEQKKKLLANGIKRTE
jgi:hypothetical protein